MGTWLQIILLLKKEEEIHGEDNSLLLIQHMKAGISQKELKEHNT